MASTEEIWKERVLQLVRDEKLGLRVAGLSQLWDEKYPEKYADSKPGPKSAGPKRLVQSKLDGRVVVDRWDYIFECQDGDYLDESEVKELRMQENKDPPKSGYNEDREEWLRICHAFKEALQEDERKPQWSCSYTRLEKGAKELYRCVIQCGLPWEPVPGQHELVGCWAYEYENKKHQFEISQRLEYSEADLDGGMTKGTLTQVFDDNYCNWKVQTEFKNEDEDDWQVGPALALRFGEGKKLQVCGCQVVFCGREIQSNCFDFVAERMTICSFTGYGSEPSESAASAIEVARQDVRMPAARPRVAVQSTPSPSKSKKAVALAPVDDAVSVRFKDATVDLRNLLDSLTALRSAVAAGKPAKSPGAATAATDKGNRESWDVEALGVEDAGRNAYDAMQLFELRDLCTSRGLDAEGDRKQLTMRLEDYDINLQVEFGENLEKVVTAVCDMLTGKDAVPQNGEEPAKNAVPRVPLTDPRWETFGPEHVKLLSIAWQYALAVADPNHIRRIGLALRSACREGPAGPAAAPLGPEAAPEGGASMPFSLWEDLIDKCVRVAHMQDLFDRVKGTIGVAEAGLEELPATLVSAEMQYSAHFIHLLSYERASEIRQEISKEMDADSRGDKPSMKFQALLPDGWATAVDPGSGRTYYSNQDTCESRWDRPEGNAMTVTPRHRPDVRLRLNPDVESLRARADGGGGCFLKKEDVAILVPMGPMGASWDEGVFVEASEAFNYPDALEDPKDTKRIIKLKLWSVTLPAGSFCEIFRATDFLLVPLRSSIPYVRQVEAVKNNKREERGGTNVTHPALRSMVVGSWSAARGLAGPGLAAADLRGAPAAILAAESEEPPADGASPQQLAAQRPEDLTPLPATGEIASESDSADESGLGAACGIPLTAMQQLAVKDASSRRCTLVRGPPGTGKTHTACAIIDRWMKLIKGDCRILVVTQSNAAAVNIQERLEHFDEESVRLSSQMTLDELLGQRRLEQVVGKDNKALEELKLAKKRNEEAPRAAFNSVLQTAAANSKVVVMTCISSGRSDFINSTLPPFSRVLLDEAAQATEPTALVPLMTGAKGFACVGDDRQLPATILSQWALAQGLGESLFERFVRSEVVRPGDGFVQLDVQRRMHSSIAQFPSRRFYEDSISNGCENRDRPPIPGIRWPNGGDHRVLFVNCEGHEEQIGTSFQNLDEADCLLETLTHLLKVREGGITAEKVACITGYSAQKNYLKEKFSRPQSGSRNVCRNVRVDTVDGFQGMERDLVLVSLTRNKGAARGSFGFLSDPRRVNVLLTRARRGLIVFGHWNTLSQEKEIWQPWLDWIQNNKCWVESRVLLRDLQAGW